MPVRIKAKRKNDYGTVDVDGWRLVPCGKCSKCKQRRVNDWILRLSEEDKQFNGSLFVTLTYDNDHVLLTNKGWLTCSKRHCQLFFKRLRKLHGKRKLKYYLAAEYGGITMRPHYHIILFGADREKISLAWPLGSIFIGTVTGASMGYTLKYISKEKQVPKHANDDRLPEFSLMSKNLGLSYLTSQMARYHRNLDASYFVKEGGYKAALPRYYRDRLWSVEERELLNENSQARYRTQMNKRIVDAGSLIEYYRLQGEIARNDLYQLKLKNFKRDKL